MALPEGSTAAAAAAAARRRALRRQRILENADQRVQKILGENVTPLREEDAPAPTPTDNPTTPTVDAQEEDLTLGGSSLPAEDPVTMPRSRPRPPPCHTPSMDVSGAVTPAADLPSPRSRQPTMADADTLPSASVAPAPPTASAAASWLLLGGLSRLALQLSVWPAWPPVAAVFLACFLVAVTWVACMPHADRPAPSSMLRLALQLGGVTPQWTQRLINAYELVQTVTQSLGLYAFAFIVTHGVLFS